MTATGDRIEARSRTRKAAAKGRGDRPCIAECLRAQKADALYEIVAVSLELSLATPLGDRSFAAAISRWRLEIGKAEALLHELGVQIAKLDCETTDTARSRGAV